MPTPRLPAPPLVIPTVAHGAFDLAREAPRHFTLIVFYRGLHCPICGKYLLELARQVAEFERRGVGVIAVSTDGAERARGMADKLGTPALRIGYDLTLARAREWGLYLSTSRGRTSVGIDEPAVFSEPGLFLVRADGTLFGSIVQTMPFARPSLAELIGAVDFATAHGYPARGEYTGPS